ncbi:hypothetical protein [Szabonella alba]|uniref:Tat pathway signal sequence domain protein n=1 Tax=Szabonella alba TaxID=2804194 RepID=A0A8K0V7R1_9RHOB|nr:hypothetical protein [Szabonella alba]MBL4916913.1 hypothetical protein [Szabonella alba]
MKCLIPALLALMAAPPLWAQTDGDGPAKAPALLLELNDAETVGEACRLTFVVENRLGTDLAALGIEAVIFTPEGGVERLLSLDLQSAPAGRPRVRQFDLPGLDCARLGRVLVNAVTPCEGEGLAAETCAGALSLTSRNDDVEVSG